MNKTAIEYLDFTWNPIAMRCTPVSEGCTHCWHLRIAHRFSKNPNFSDEVRAAYAGGDALLVEKRLLEPLKHKQPARIGVQFMGDLFGEVMLGDVERVWHIMEAAHWHTFTLLTKRPEKMDVAVQIMKNYSHADSWPPPNIGLGVTAENEPRWRERVPVLRHCDAAWHFVSCEPLLGEIRSARRDLGSHAISWVIAGAETGPGARDMNPAWARLLMYDCRAADVPFFIKRMSPGERTPDDLMIREFPKEAQL